MKNQLPVLDGGYVRLVTYTPWNMVALREAVMAEDLTAAQSLLVDHDLAAVNAARASFAKESEFLTDKDKRLLRFLAEAKPTPHSSPFRHAHVTLEVSAPLAVCRQWWRHVVGCGTTEEGTNWSELSRRYVRGDIDCHIPSDFREAPANAKQGSGGLLPSVQSAVAHAHFAAAVNAAIHAYEEMIDLGVAPEQARMVLPQSVYTTFRWTPSVQGLAQFLVQRLDNHAQWEIQEYARVVTTLVLPLFPYSLHALLDSYPSEN